MSSTAAVAAHGAHAEHHQLSFMRTYIFSEDHKMIARQFLFMALFMMSIGGLMAMLMRWELAFPETAVPGFHWVPEPFMYDGAIPPNTYNAMFTMHATIMIFFVVMPILVGCFGNFLIPLDDRRARHGVPQAEHAVVLGRRGRRRDHAVVVLRDRRTRRRGLDVVRSTQRGTDIHRRRLGPELVVHQHHRARRVVADGLDQLHHDDHQHAHQGDVLLPHAAGDLVAVHHGDSAAARAAGADHGARVAAVRSHGRHAFLPARGRRRAAAVAASVLVLRPSRSLHHDPARDGHFVGDHLGVFAQADLRLPRDGVCDDRDRRVCRGSSGAITCSCRGWTRRSVAAS